MHPSYKHAVSVTGQVFFCAAPIRLDAYDGCQFGCLYCFSRKRTRWWAKKGLHQASVRAFEGRLNRVAAGLFASALDEFLGARVPIQLGGLHDPFTPRERTLEVTLRLLRVLRDRQYPTLISTKGELVAEHEYLAVLKEMIVAVRFSAAGVSEKYRLQIDRRCADFDRTLEKISKLACNGVATALRIQPVIPGFEQNALDIARKAAAAGAKRISFEYLKLPKETVANEIKVLSSIVGFDLLKYMSRAGLSTVGWDYSLLASVKCPFCIRSS